MFQRFSAQQLSSAKEALNNRLAPVVQRGVSPKKDWQSQILFFEISWLSKMNRRLIFASNGKATVIQRSHKEALNNPKAPTTKLKQAKVCFRQLIVLQKKDLALPVLFLTKPSMKNRRKAVIQRSPKSYGFFFAEAL